MKKIIIMLITVCMILSLVACGNVSEKEVEEKGTSGEQVISEKVVDKKSDGGNKSNVELNVDADYANLPESEGFVFESNGDGTCTLSKIGNCEDTNIVIPEKSPDGDTITKIGEYAFSNVEDIESIIFAGKIMELDKKAFQSCSFKKLVISGCNLGVGEYAFSYCENINDIYISNSIVEIDSYAFYDSGKNINTKIVNCSGTLKEKAFRASHIIDLTIKDSKLELGEYTFSYCGDIATTTMEKCTIDIGSYAFYDSGDDTVVTFTDCGLAMDDKAFQSCGLIRLNLAGCETTMGEYTFSYCEELTEVTIGTNNTEIGSYSFYDCTSLANVTIAAESDNDEIQIVIDDKAFQSCSAEKVVIGRASVEIGDYAFSYCEDLASVELKGSSLDVGKYAFYDCLDTLAITYKGKVYDKESIEDLK